MANDAEDDSAKKAALHEQAMDTEMTLGADGMISQPVGSRPANLRTTETIGNDEAIEGEANASINASPDPGAAPAHQKSRLDSQQSYTKLVNSNSNDRPANANAETAGATTTAVVRENVISQVRGRKIVQDVVNTTHNETSATVHLNVNGMNQLAKPESAVGATSGSEQSTHRISNENLRDPSAAGVQSNSYQLQGAAASGAARHHGHE